MANKLNPELVKNISDLITVKKISDLPIIDVIDKDNETTKIRTSQQFNNSYLLSSTLLEDNSYVGGRYFNYRVKLNEVTKYLSTLSDEKLAAFKQTFNFFVDSLKNNTENSYVQFAPANDTIDTENADNNYSDTFRYKLSEVLDDVIGFTYNITSDGIEEISTYSYTNVLTEGLVTNATLEKYVRNSIANILGVPSSPAQLSEAIDSVIEFVNWFKGYSKEKDGLTELIRKITEKDDEIISSYTNAYNALNLRIDTTNNRIDDLDITKNAEEGKYITGIQQKDGLITNITSKQITISEVEGLQSAIDNIGIDVPINGVSTDGNSFTAEGTKYTLTVDKDKKLKFVEYVLMSINSKTPDTTRTLEIDSNASEAERMFKVVANKTINSATWQGMASDDTVTTNDKTTTLIAKQKGNNKITRSVTISDGEMNVMSGDMHIQFTNTRYFLGYSSNPNLIFNDVKNSESGTNINITADYNNLKDSLLASDIYGKGFTGNGYWYLIWPTSLNIGNIYFGAGTAKAAAAGGWHEHVQNWQEGDPVTNSNHIKVNQYSTAVQYHVYRSDHPFSVQMNIQF